MIAQALRLHETTIFRHVDDYVNKWLHHHGFSYKYLKGVPHKFDEKKQADFIEKYTELKAQAIDEPILFMDAMHPSQATKVSCGWIKNGHDKAIETTGSRARLNLIGAIDLNNLANAQVKCYEKINSETIQTFFTELRAENGSNKRIHLILDGAGYHRAKIVKDKTDELNI
ncbi:MAG: hypothetical protein ACI89T_000278 [Cognaticolwellia sp.]|jgi:hypothetical protein